MPIAPQTFFRIEPSQNPATYMSSGGMGGGGGYRGGYAGGAAGGFGGAGGFHGGAHGANGCAAACGVGPGEDCTACGVGCGSGGGNGALSHVGPGQGSYALETTYQYVGYGGDFGRPKRDFTCIITGCCLLSLLLIPLLLWLLSGTSTSLPYDCGTGMGPGGNLGGNFGGVNDMMIERMWSQAQKDYCCMTVGRGCATTALPQTTPTIPPTPFPTPPPTPPP